MNGRIAYVQTECIRAIKSEKPMHEDRSEECSICLNSNATNTRGLRSQLPVRRPNDHQAKRRKWATLNSWKKSSSSRYYRNFSLNTKTTKVSDNDHSLQRATLTRPVRYKLKAMYILIHVQLRTHANRQTG